MGNEEDEALARSLRQLAAADPVREVIAQDALRAQWRYPVLVLAGPMFGVAEQTAEGWRVVSLGEATPQCSRDDLASHLRMLAADLPDAEDYLSAARLLDWERHDELTVAGRRFRVVRVEQVLRMSATEPEPPRPSDADPRRPPARPAEVIAAPAPPHRGELDRQFADAVHRPGRLSAEARAEAERALADYPVLAPMSPAFSVAEYLHDGWRSATAAAETPQRARESLAEYFRHVLPAIERPDSAARAAYERAAAVLTEGRLNELEVQGRRFRIVRMEKVARLGPDGPEPPRRSDFDPDPPVEVLALQLRAEGLLED